MPPISLSNNNRSFSARGFRLIMLTLNKIFVAIIILTPIRLWANDLLLYGGDNHDVFLGCLNCDKTNPLSVCGDYNDFGNRYGEKSIWNNYGSYGSRYDDTSPWNTYAGNPPVIVDKNGNFYGYFSSNKYQHKRTEIDYLIVFLDRSDWVLDNDEAAKSLFCGG